jgi:excisionase family DNA binding protein
MLIGTNRRAARMVAMVEEQTFTVAEVAKRLRTSEATIRAWLRSGKLGGYRLGGDKIGWRVSESDLARFIQASRGRQPE